MRPRTALDHFAASVGPQARPRAIADGLVNRTWAVDRPPRFALQEVAAEFGAEVNRHIDAVTRALAAAGMATPRLVPTDDGRLALPGEKGRHWRLLTWVDGVNHHAVPSPDHARRAAGLIARFHDALIAGRIISPALLERALQPNDGNYGYGWQVLDLLGRPMHNHTGGTNGATSHIAYYPQSDLLIVVFNNVEGENPKGTACDLARISLNVAPLPDATNEWLTQSNVDRCSERRLGTSDQAR